MHRVLCAGPTRARRASAAQTLHLGDMVLELRDARLGALA
jgi:hypothetical protein